MIARGERPYHSGDSLVGQDSREQESIDLLLRTWERRRQVLCQMHQNHYQDCDKSILDERQQVRKVYVIT